MQLEETLSKKILTDNVDKAATRDGYGEGVLEAGKDNKDIVVLTADVTESTRNESFKNKYPNRFFSVGVAEQNLAGIAAGLALSGKIPFMASYATFSPGRNWDQIRVSICYSNANVKIVGAHAGISVGADGATHQALEDLALTRVLPNLTVISPADAKEAKKATIAAAKHQGPVYIRLHRSNTPIMTLEKTPFEIGKAQVWAKGSDITICATGPMVYQALEAAQELQKEHHIKAEVINVATIKPLDKETILKSAKKTKKVITVEEHQIAGGMGSAIAELLSEEFPVQIARIGVNDTFGESGQPELLLEKYGLTAQHIVNKAIQIYHTK